MIDFFENFHFLRPWFLVLLILPLWGYRHFFSGMKNVSAWKAVCDKNLLDFLLVKGSSGQRSFIGWSVLVGLTGAVLALSGPSWQKRNMPAYAPANPVMILLNLSSDMDNQDITPNRLLRAKYAIDDLLKEIVGQVGLIVYSNEPYLISPITEDTKILSNLLPAVNRNILPENGDRLNRAIDLAAERLKQGGYPWGTIVVFTPDVGQDFNIALESAEKAAQSGYEVDVVGVRADNYEKLELLADKGRGLYILVNEGLKALVAKIDGKLSSELKKTQNEKEIWEDGGYYLLFIPIICCLFFFRRGILILLLWLCMSSSASAGFFTNNNQDGIKAFAEGNYETAAKSFERQDWKAASYYRNGDFEKAVQAYQSVSGSDNLYNLGNALAKAGKIDEAIKIYEKVLAQNAQHEDAKFNLEYLKKQQQKNQQQQSQQKQNNKDEQQEQKQSQTQKDKGNDAVSEQSSADSEKQEQAKDEQQQGAQSEQDENKNSDEQSDNQQDDTPQKGDAESQQSASDDKNGKDGQNSESQVPSAAEPDEKSDDEAQGISSGRTQDEKGDFDEQTQAREMTYRNIPEDSGGLLRAFIRKEYNKNRYGDR